LPIRFLVFTVVTGLMPAVGVLPFRPGLGAGGEPRHLFVGALEAAFAIVAEAFDLPAGN
jgi:hypothetical protein